MVKPMDTPIDTPQGPRPDTTSTGPDPRDRIIDAALALAGDKHWEAVRLQDVAAAAGLQMTEVHRHFREKEDIVEAFFDRADRAMLAVADTDEFRRLSSRERIHRLIMAWLEALQPHRRIVRQMITCKLEPGHLHVQIPAVLRISRTVQWVREAAGRQATFVHRALEETALTSIYVSTFIYWMRDRSENTERTRRMLARTLERAESFEHMFAPPTPRRARTRRPTAAAPRDPARDPGKMTGDPRGGTPVNGL
jgi:ubiquinone biosynthesis protein COQ9